MYSDQLVLEGKQGVRKLDQSGPYAVIVNRTLYEQGRAGKFAVVNAQQRWVDSVHGNQATAARQARQLDQT
jgi:hypothetical protein